VQKYLDKIIERSPNPDSSESSTSSEMIHSQKQTAVTADVVQANSEFWNYFLWKNKGEFLFT